MPTWGITVEQALREPWGLDPSLLAPAKTITDPIHGDIYLNELERRIVDSAPMQRLRRVRQLGTTQLVYPSATHTRFSHALGTLRAAQDLLDAIWISRTAAAPGTLPPNLLDEYLRKDGGEGTFLSDRFAEATVLARLGGLMHDLCHVPIGHTIEDDLRVLVPHDENEQRFKKLWSDLDPSAIEAIEAAGKLAEELRVLIISKDARAKKFKSDYPFVQDIVGNTICADLGDYLRRDHFHTGLPMALGHRFMDSFFVTSADHPIYPAKMVIRIERGGRRRNDVITELVKFLRYRYELTERVLTHHGKTAADSMLGKLLGLYHEELWLRTAIERYPNNLSTKATTNSLTISRTTARIDLQRRRRNLPSKTVSKSVEAELEAIFLRHSDDGLLEMFAALEPAGSRRLVRVRQLARDLLARRLFKALGHAGSAADQAVAAKVYESFGSFENRRNLERAAAQFAGIDPDRQVAIWMPDPRMRLKVAEVLVYSKGMVAPLHEVEDTSREIAEKHRRLWDVQVFADSTVVNDDTARLAVLSYLRERTGLVFRQPDGAVVPAPRELAVHLLVERTTKSETTRRDLLALVDPAASNARTDTFKSMQEAIRLAGIGKGLLDDDVPK